MPIDFLGGEKKVSAKKQGVDVKWHIPEKEKRRLEKEAKIKEQVKAAEKVPVRRFEEVNLVIGFKKYLLKRRLTFIIIFVIIITGGLIAYFYFMPEPGEPLPVIVNENKNINQPIVSPPAPPPTPQPPVPEPPPPSQILLDTELAPIKGSVIKFKNENTLYLIEDNGELRKIDRLTVVFDNGQSINDISPSLIYTLADRFKNIRRGEDVIGSVDWDPRVLRFVELSPFLE